MRLAVYVMHGPNVRERELFMRLTMHYLRTAIPCWYPVKLVQGVWAEPNRFLQLPRVPDTAKERLRAIQLAVLDALENRYDLVVWLHDDMVISRWSLFSIVGSKHVAAAWLENKALLLRGWEAKYSDQPFSALEECSIDRYSQCVVMNKAMLCRLLCCFSCEKVIGAGGYDRYMYHVAEIRKNIVPHVGMHIGYISNAREWDLHDKNSIMKNCFYSYFGVNRNLCTDNFYAKAVLAALCYVMGDVKVCCRDQIWEELKRERQSNPLYGVMVSDRTILRTSHRESNLCMCGGVVAPAMHKVLVSHKHWTCLGYSAIIPSLWVYDWHSDLHEQVY